ncbi:MAG: efflux RND transporter periplasmic adaptor subunit [Myxococcaceae bacterium]
MSTEVLTDELPPPLPPPRPTSRLTFGLIAVVVVVLAAMAGLSARASSKQNQVALSAAPRGVTVVAARPASFREERRYVGVVEPWVEAKVGPEFVSAWVDTVLVRPGDKVKRNEVLATLDCRNASTNTENAVQQARSLEERQRAMASEAARLENLLGGGFISANEIDQKKAQAAAAQAQLDGLKAQLRSRTLEAGDCTLRAPFDGEVAIRHADPGAFARPGMPLVTLIDRHVVRVVFDVPEVDYPLLDTGAPAELTLLATGQVVHAALTRRAPAANASSRTLRVEIDLDGAVNVPVGTSVGVRFEVGAAKESTEVPLVAAKVRGTKATVFVIDHDVARKLQVPVLGERGGSVFLAGLAPDAHVVTEGRATLTEGDRVTSKLDGSWPPPAPPSVPPGTTADVGPAGGGRP